MYESPLIKMHQQIKKREGNSCLSMLIKTPGKKKRGKVMSEHAHKGTNIWEKKKKKKKERETQVWAYS